ncbi:LysR substrate-binding domain-containing protein [Umezawaea sp. Da 62-37]|uniref:LysR family transcriptional regulator n=1 Tax=Umezawaea sp. Da 62-37 TaxID=3075927 RepID=UPI0028F6E726|nr:LysR substrate-binding domain-containing protein [Umezawaea sp. Da 62-37]WNV86891.1 LysR substrate-binding domain-containing protein [Umezawaea sp. Da 62-37]
MGDLDLRRLRYFLALADELNYGRAAEALHIAQPALSRSISALEQELGVTLFERSRSGTRLAAAGEFLREEARELLRAAETVQRRVRLSEREGHGLTIGFSPGLIITPVVRRMRETRPALRVDVVRTSWTDQIQSLRDGRIDASFAHRPFDDDGLTVIDLFAEPRFAALPADHALAASENLLLADLAGEVLLQPVAAVPEWTGVTAPPVPPDDDGTAHSPNVEVKLELVAAGRGVVVMPASTTRYYHRPDIAYVRVADLPDTRVCLVVESRRRSDVLRELVEVALADADPASVGNKQVLDATATPTAR